MQFALVVADQQQQPGIGLNQRQGFRQHPIQQVFKLLFRRQRRANIEKAADGRFHQRHRLGELIHFGDDRMHRNRFLKLEAADLRGGVDQAVQMAGDIVREQPGHR